MIAVIAWATCREAVRSRSFVLLLGIYALGVILSRIVGWVSATDGDVVTTDIVMSLQSLVGVLVAVATGTALVHAEITNKTLYTILSRPVERWQFVLGKFLGLVLSLLAGQAAMLVIGLGYLLATGTHISGWLVLAGLMTAIEVLVMAAVSLCWTALSGPLLAAVLGLATYAMGHAVASLPDLMNHLKGWQAPAVATLASLVPNLGMFTYRDQAVYGIPMSATEVLIRVGYGVLWIALLATITTAVIRRKQL